MLPEHHSEAPFDVQREDSLLLFRLYREFLQGLAPVHGENRLAMSDDARYLEGLRLYYCGQYWDSHEAWEELWHPAKGAVRHFLQGLIQLDAALIHTERG